MNKRTLVRIVSFLTALILVLGVGAWSGNVSSIQYRTALENGYRRSLEELTTLVGNIENTLRKGVYTGTDAQLTLVAAQLWKDAAAAKSCLSSLPVSDLHLENTYRFLSQVGDFAMALSKRSSQGKTISSDERSQFVSLVGYAGGLGGELSGLADMVVTGNISLGALPDAGDDPALATLSAGFEQMEEGFTGYPKLIYDGPFSDHIMEVTPKMTQGQTTISRAAAHKKAAAAANLAPEFLADAADENSLMPLYCFTGSGFDVGVTKQGGYLCYLSNSRTIGDPVHEPGEAIAAAKEYLSSIGIASMEQSYYETANGICTINFAYQKDGITFYTDLIKVGVALDTGEVVFFDARGFLTNHGERDVSGTLLSVDAAKSKVSPLLSIKSDKLAVIPTGGGEELLCREFLGESSDGQKVLVYINARTGVEEQLLILLETPNGVLTA